MPLVSIIIPTYNRSNLLKRAIQSVLEQTLQDYEIVVVDDCSKDNTQGIVNSFQDERIKYIKLDKNSGGSLIPRTTGVEKSSGKYIAVLDDDDFWVDKSKLAIQIMYFENHPECVLIGTDAIAFNGNSTILAKHHYPKTYLDIKKHMLMQNCFFHSSVVYRRDILKQIGGFTLVNGGFYNNFVNEYELWLKFGIIGELINLPIYGVGYTYSSKFLKMRDRLDFLKRHLKITWKYKQYYSNFIKASIFNCIITILELPFLIWIKRIVRKY